MPFKCPHCGTPLLRESVSLLPSFECTKCHAKLRISRVYGIVARILAGGLSLIAYALLGASGSHFFVSLALFLLLFFISYSPISFFLTAYFPPRVHADEDIFLRLDIPR